MSEDMPVQIDVLRLAKKGSHLAGQLPLSRMTRLADLLNSTEGRANVELEFGLDGQHIPYLKGNVTTCLELTCQRCLESMQYPIDHTFLLGIVKSEQAASRLPDEYEPLLVDDQPSRLADIIEDEIILSLPVVAMHPEEDCPASKILLNMETNTEARSEANQDKESPFAKLGELMKQDLDLDLFVHKFIVLSYMEI